MKIIAVVLVILTIYCSAILGQYRSFKSCPNIPVQKNFNSLKFIGTWYEVERHFTVQDIGMKCTTKYIKEDENEMISITKSFIKTIGGPIHNITERGSVEDNSGDGVLRMAIPPSSSIEPAFHDYDIMETDYSNYAVAWSCLDLNYFNLQTIYILTRVRQPSQEILDKAHGIFKRYITSKTILLSTQHESFCNN